MGTFVILAAVAVVATVLILAARRPDAFRVERSTVIGASAETIYSRIADLNAWSAWSPWERKDPAMRKTHYGPPSGVGAAYVWEGDRNVGCGRMEIIEVDPPRLVALKLDFVKPFPASNRVVFALSPEAPGTRVTWSMEGPVPFFAKIIHLFMNIDRMVGRDFEAGLAALKAETEAKALSPA